MAARGGISGGRGPAAAVAKNTALLQIRASRLRNMQPVAFATVNSCNAMIAKAYAEKREPFGPKWKKLRYREEPPPTLQSKSNDSKDATKFTAAKGVIRFYTTHHMLHHMCDPQSAKRTFPKRNPTPLHWPSGSRGYVFKPQVIKAHERRNKQYLETGLVTE